MHLKKGVNFQLTLDKGRIYTEK